MGSNFGPKISFSATMPAPLHFSVSSPFFQEGETILDKRRPTIFIGSEYESLLLNRRTTTVVIVGCTTRGNGPRRVQPRLLHGGRERLRGDHTEEGHRGALKRMEGFADIVDSKEIIDIWR